MIRVPGSGTVQGWGTAKTRIAQRSHLKCKRVPWVLFLVSGLKREERIGFFARTVVSGSYLGKSSLWAWAWEGSGVRVVPGQTS